MIHTIEKLSAAQAAAAAGIGSGISIATVISLDPLALTPWLRVATLAVGLLTGLVSLAIVMKLVQKRRDMRSRRA
jgi:formate-dependent nitrite reductase membrane component NrfD